MSGRFSSVNRSTSLSGKGGFNFTRGETTTRINDSGIDLNLLYLTPGLVMERKCSNAQIYGELSGDIFTGRNLAGGEFLVFPLKMSAEVVDVGAAKVSKIPNVASIAPLGDYLVKLTPTNCMHLYTGDLLMAQINVPQLIASKFHFSTFYRLTHPFSMQVLYQGRKHAQKILINKFIFK